MMDRTISEEHLDQLREAKRLLENPSVAARISNVLGTPIEKGIALLPAGANQAIVKVAKGSLESALRVAISTMAPRHRLATNRIHKTAAAVTGAVGGAFGLAALAIELPVSTTIMLRSIADIARSEGEQLESPEARLACLEVFALGGRASNDDAAESGYFGVRAALAKALSDAVEYVARHGMVQEGAPALVRFVTQITARFSIPVTEKAAAQALPLIGAAGGALVNTLFIDHFQDIARGHFVVRRLERSYNPALVKAAYLRLKPEEPERPSSD
jgi:hypothetical protein